MKTTHSLAAQRKSTSNVLMYISFCLSMHMRTYKMRHICVSVLAESLRDGEEP